MYFVYILRCVDDSLYVGLTQNLNTRLKAHNDGRGAAYTFKRRPVSLVYWEKFERESQAVEREGQLKRWSHAKKQALIEGEVVRLKQLSQRRS